MVAGVGLLLERDAELDRLRGMLGQGAVALVTGAAGIGKTHLVRALRHEAEQEGMLVLAARGAELEHDYAFGVVRQWFDPLLRAGEPLEGAAALAGPALVGEVRDGGDASFSVLHGLYWLTAGLAARRPVLLVLDDAQWSDDASLRFAGFLARRLEGLPLLLLLTARTPVAGAVAELASDPATGVLELSPLGIDAVAAFLRERSGGPVDESFACACLDASCGNPFLLGELAQALLAEDVEFAAAERGRVPAVGPTSVARSVQLRLARLPAAATRLARAAAVAGDDAPLSLVAEVAGVDDVDADDAADELARAGVLDDARPVRFTHPIVGAAIRESLLAGERQALHARTAQLLAEAGAPAEAIAVHLLALDPAGDPYVVDTLVEAAAHARAGGAAESAAALLERALAEPPPEEVRAHILLALGEAEHVLERASAAERLREAHRLAVDPSDRARAALLLTWAVVSGTEEPRDVTGLLERSIEELAPVDRDLALRLEAAWLGLAWDRNDLDAILARGERYAGLEGRTPGECLVLAYLGHASMDDGRPACEAAALAERAVRLEPVSDLALNSNWLIHTGTVLRSAERIDTALRVLDHVVADAQQKGLLRAYLIASMYRSAVLNRAGDLRAAEADARAALAADSREVVLLPALAQLVESLVEQDRAEEAAELLERHGLTDAVPEFRHATVLLFSRAMLRAELGDLAGALADLDETRARLDCTGRLNVVGLDGRVRAALIRRELGRVEQADREAQVAVDAARAWGTPGAIGLALRGLALVRGELELLREGTSLLAESPLRLEHAKALLDLGSMLRRSGARTESRGPLRDALALADELGAARVRELAREELAASGIRVRRTVVHGSAALTPSERRIAERAAAGASNPEIAQALFVTVKTVEMHLSNAYRKLGISGRRELERALISRG